jgi:AcrR family transcriptional regulator
MLCVTPMLVLPGVTVTLGNTMSGSTSSAGVARSARAARDARREELLDAADRAIRTHGPDVTMAQMAAAAGVTKPILYRHFDDKGGLYAALATRHVAALMAALEGSLSGETDPRTRLAKTIEAYLAFVERHPREYRFLMRRAVIERSEAQRTVQAFVRQVAERVTGVLEAELTRAGVATGAAPAWAHGIVGMVQLAADWWLDERSMQRDELADALVTLLWSGFGSLPGAGGGR